MVAPVPTDDEEPAMAQGPDWKQLIETGMNFTEMRRSQARELVSELVSQGQLAQDRAAAAVDELLELSRRRREDLRSFVQAEIQRQVSALGIATHDDLARLERRITGSPAKKPAAKKTAVKKAPAKRAAKATPAKKPAAASSTRG